MYYAEKWIDGKLYSRSDPKVDWALVTDHQIIRRSALEQAAQISRNGCLFPPDGGSPSGAEVQMCDEIAEAILAVV